MLRITCPYCGPRDQDEFQYGGEAHIERPQYPEEATDSEWADYLFYRKNPKGIHLERWVHLHGCKQWFNVARDTHTHDVYAIYPMGDPPPDINMMGEEQA